MSSSNATPPDQTSFLGDLMAGKFPGVKSIEQVYSRAGASKHHTPGHTSKLGSQKQQPHGPDQKQGLGSASFKEGFQEQRAEVCISSTRTSMLDCVLIHF
jgi:hypothetical protein